MREARAEGRAESRAEAEAAAEQRLAALDQARHEEREAAVRAAPALGARQASACPARLLPLAYAACSPVHHTMSHAVKQPQSRPAWSRHGLQRGSACCRLIEALETVVSARTGRCDFQAARLATRCLPVPAPGYGDRDQGGGGAAAR